MPASEYRLTIPNYSADRGSSRARAGRISAVGLGSQRYTVCGYFGLGSFTAELQLAGVSNMEVGGFVKLTSVTS